MRRGFVTTLAQRNRGATGNSSVVDTSVIIPTGLNVLGKTTILEALQKRSATPSCWDFEKLSLNDAAIIACRNSVLEGSERFAELYSVIYGVIAQHQDGSTSPVFRNIPPVTDRNRCAETALAAFLENLHFEVEGDVSKVTQITLVGYTPPDSEKERFQFSNHPNPCALCRDRLLTLRELGILGEDTKVLNVALNQDGSIPSSGRLTTIGSLLLGSSERSSKEAFGENLVEEAYAQLITLFPDTACNETDVSDLMTAAVSRLSDDRGESCIIFGVSDGALKAIVAEPQTISFPRGGVKNFSSTTVALTAALNEGFSRALILDFSPLKTVSAVTAQRFLDYQQHIEGQSGRVGDGFVSVVHVGFDENSGILGRVYDPRLGFPLGEGMRDRGRETLIVNGGVKFSSKLGLAEEEVDEVLRRAEVICLSDIHGRDAARNDNSSQKVSTDTFHHSKIIDPNDTDLGEITPAIIAKIKSQLSDKIQAWRKEQSTISVNSAAINPIVTAVIATTSDGSQIEKLSSVNPLSVTFESHAADPLFHVLAEILNASSNDAMKPEVIHIASTNPDFQLTLHHNRLLDVITETHGFRPKIVQHQIDELSAKDLIY